MEGEEKKIEGAAEAEKKTTVSGQESEAAKPKQTTRKRRNNISAAERKAQKEKTNAEKAAAAARKSGAAAAGEGETAPETASAVAAPAEKPHSYRSREANPEKVTADSTKAAEKAGVKNAETDETALKEATPAKKPRARKSTATKSTATKSTTTKSTAAKPAPKKTTPKKAVAEKDRPAAEDKPAEEDKHTTETVMANLTENAAEAVKKPTEPSTDQADADEKTTAEKNVADKPEEKSDEKPIMAEDESELSEEERRHKAEITRTVQVSIEQILAGSMAEENAGRADSSETAPSTNETTGAADDDSNEEVSISQRLSEAATDGLYSLLKWLLLVLAFAAVIAVMGVYWLYRGTTPDMMPQLTLSVDGQTVETAAYEWKVPVVGNLFKRTYAETLHTEPVTLPKAVENASPSIVLESDGEFDTALTIKDSAQEEVFNGTLADFEKFFFTENDLYTALLVVTSQNGNFSGDALVTGRQAYQFDFNVDIRPTVRVNTQSITQGGVVSVSVTNIPEGEIPSLVSGLSNAGFVKATKGWIAYIPIPCEADTSKSYDIRVKTASYDQTVTLTVRPRTSAYKDYSSASALTGNYIGVENTPEKVNRILDICDPQVYWMASGFVQPFIHSIVVSLPYGTTEYVGRTASQRTNGQGTGRTSTCVVVSGHQGEVIISPADGRVVLAEDLGDDAGKTVVIEHGAGLKSIFYNLDKINVEEGDPVVQGQILGETNKVTVAEVRIGRVPVEPLSIWRGQCDAVKNY